MRVLWVKAPLLLRTPISLAALGIAAEGTACLVATHDEAASLHADRVWRIEDGHIVQ